MRVLHVASFAGNLGDSASHMGLRPALERHVGPCEFTECEIRQFYRSRGERAFDDRFVEEANAHDLVLVGGGNFFELWVPGSRTGCTVEIDRELMERIHTPIVFYGVGCDDYRGAPAENVDRFAQFLVAASEAPHVLVSVRNDGSRGNIARLLGEWYAGLVDVVPDGAFLASRPAAEWHLRIAVNVAQDRLGAAYEAAAPQLAAALDSVLDALPVELLFVPHVYSDVEAIGRVLGHMDDRHRRERVDVALLGRGQPGAAVMRQLYAGSGIAVAMRLHGNIVPISQGTATVGIAATPKVRELHGELGSRSWLEVAELEEPRALLERIAGAEAPDVSGLRAQADAFLARAAGLVREAVAA